jgi:2-isopropylmalate synthase
LRRISPVVHHAAAAARGDETQKKNDATSSSSTVDDWIIKDLEFRTTTTGGGDGVVVAIDDVGDPQPRGQRQPSSGGAVRGPSTVLVYDTTLRDGTQMESISVSCDDKIKITRRLSAFGVDYIEAGWPGSNPKDEEYFRRARDELDASAFSKLVAFGSTRRKGILARDDAQVRTLVECGSPTVCIVAKAHLWQVTDILRADPAENLDMIRDTVSHLVSQGRDVMVDLEHYFDGHAFDAEYAYRCCEAAMDGGASVLVMCDTNGGSMPWDVERVVSETISRFGGDGDGDGGGRGSSTTFGIHCHNDCGLAVANTLTSVRAGVGLVQGTVNGIGERTGNADLCSIIPSLALHCDVEKMSCKGNLGDVTSLSRFVDETLNRTPNRAAPYVGASAFAHKGGLHVSAIERDPNSYQHVDPASVGNKLRVLISELSGRQNILGKMRMLDLFEDDNEDGTPRGFDDAVLNERALVILDRVKRLESMGYTFEGADASVELMILHSTRGYCPPFQVLDYTAQVYDTNVDSASRVMSKMERRDSVVAASSSKKDPAPPLVAPSSLARATIKVRVLDDPNPRDDGLPYLDRLEVSEGDGPVDALANALKKALAPSHPELDGLQLVDYKVRILDPESATRAATRVMIEFRDVETGKKWTTVSVDRNIISASLNALVDGFEYALRETVAACVVDFE